MKFSPDPVREEAAERIADAISPGEASAFTRGLAHGLLGRLRYDKATRDAVMAWMQDDRTEQS